MPGIMISDEQYDLIQKLIADPSIKAKYSFRSPSDFIRRAISEYVDKLEEDIKK